VKAIWIHGVFLVCKKIFGKVLMIIMPFFIDYKFNAEILVVLGYVLTLKFCSLKL